MSKEEKMVNNHLGKYSKEVNEATEEFMTSIINGEGFVLPHKTKKGSSLDRLLSDHPFCDKKTIEE